MIKNYLKIFFIVLTVTAQAPLDLVIDTNERDIEIEPGISGTKIVLFGATPTGKRDIIIDSKVSLSAWHDYSNTKDETNKAVHLKKFLDAVKTFVSKLSKDDYSKLYDINTIDNVLMFIPIEPALLTLYHEGIKIIEDAWQKKIIIVGPSTLPFLLKAIENMWRVDKQTKTIKDIAASATDIYNKTVNVYNSFELASQSIDKAKSKMKDAKSQLQDGPGSLTSKLNKMKNLGRLNTKKELPDDMEDDIK